jgi:hypothetical protein
MVFRVQGKRDKKERFLWLWADDECPDLCPVRHLLVFIFLANIVTGPIFPNLKDLVAETITTVPILANNQPTTTREEVSMSYEKFSKFFQKIVSECVDERGMKVGLQMLRKTGYLLGVWGGGLFHDLRMCARHETESSADRYLKDAIALKLVDTLFHDPDNRVSEFRSIVCLAPNQATYLNLPSSANCLESINQLAREFVSLSLCIPLENPLVRDQRFLIKKAMAYIVKSTALDELRAIARELFQSGAQDAAQAAAKAAVDAFLKNQHQDEQQEEEADKKPHGRLSNSKQQQKRKHNECTNEEEDVLVGWKEFAALCRLEDKVHFLIKLREESPCLLRGPVVGPAKTFYFRTMKPILGCLDNHFAKNVDNFCNHWNQGFRAKFSTKCCTGKVEVACGTTGGRNNGQT